MMSSPPKNRLCSQALSCADVLDQVLAATLRDGRPADRALNYVFRRNRKFGSRDRRLIAESVFSVFRWLGWLQSLPVLPRDLAHHFPAAGLSRDSLMILLAGAWILEPGTADTAVVEQTLAMLAILGNADALLAPPTAEERLAALSHLLGSEPGRPSFNSLMPEWVEREANPPIPWNQVAQRFQTRPPIYIRIQGPGKNDRRVVEWLEEAGADIQVLPPPFRAVRLHECPVNLYQADLFNDGAFELQDAASQLVGIVCSPAPGQRWWDCCAGAGGKSLQLADLMQGRGHVLASDVREYKLDDSRNRARRGGFSNLARKPWNGNRLPCKSASFDGVLVDAPCTCSGTWRRNPDGRWTTRPEDVAEMRATQLHILERAAKAVRPGGLMVYATCSMFTAENQDVVAQFLATSSDFILAPFPHPFAAGECDGMLQIWPWDMDSDAMFVAKLRRTSS